jgi:hypothetical protein
VARGRMISKSLSTSEKFASLTTTAGPLAEFCQLLYPLIVAHADDFGRLQGDTFTIKHMCFPASPRSVDEFCTALAYLHASGMLIRYEVDGKRYIQIENFDEHQTGLYKRTASKFPEVTGTSRKVTELPAQENLTEGKGTEEKERKAAAKTPRPRPVENPNDNGSIITKIAHEAIDLEGINADLGQLTDAVKSLCAIRDIAYSGEVVRKAVDSAIHQRRRAS